MRPLPALLLVLALAVSCETSDGISSIDIVEGIPWQVPETASYRVLDDDGEDVGTLELSIEEVEPGLLEFRQYFDFPEQGFTNEAVVVADEGELQPQSASFRIEGPEGDLTCDAAYAAGEVTVHRVGEDGERTDKEDVPVIAYDSWSDLFLWRTIDFEEGYETEYADVLSCTLARTQKQGVTLMVREIEEIDVPAGTFETWRLEIESGGETQRAWYSTGEARTLVRYDNGREVFELTAGPG